MAKNGAPKFFYGYIIVLAGFFLQVVGWGLCSTFGVFFNPLLIEFGWTRAMISGAFSLSFLILGFISIIVGGLNDRLGPRMIMVVCGLFLGSGYLLMSQLNTIWQLYLFYGVIVGIGMSGMDVLSLSTIARWFVRRRGMMSGIVKAGAGIGMVIMPPIANWLISSYGWRTSYFIIGIIALVFIILVAQFLRRDPAQMGQLPDGEEKVNIGCLNSADGGFSLQEAIHARQFWMLCVIFLLVTFCVEAIIVHIVPHATDLGISAVSAANILAAIGGVSIIGRFVMGSAGDKAGNRLAIIVCFLILLVSLLWMLVAKELWMLYLFACVYGFAHGGFFALISPSVAEFFGLSSHGVILGAVFCLTTIGGAIGPVLAGHIFDVTSSYQLAFLVFTVVCIVGFILTLLLKPVTNVERAR